MKIKEIRGLDKEALVTRKTELLEESFKLRLQQQTGQLENPAQLTKNRKTVARIETVLAELDK
ncbi:MAG TPA: 50S ribosomal protein L29 [Chthoniobacterales bacterium]